MASLNVASLSLGDVYTSPKGGKSVPVTVDGQAVYQTLPAMKVLFEPKSFDGTEASRVSLCMRPPPETVQLMQELDKALIALAAKSSVALFGKELSQEQVAERYQSCLKEGQYPLFRAKLNLGGSKKTRLWQKGQRCEAPELWQGGSVTPIVNLKGLWLTKGECGPVFDICDALIEREVDECPFR